MIQTLLTILYFVIAGISVYLAIEIYKQYFALELEDDDEDVDEKDLDDNEKQGTDQDKDEGGGDASMNEFMDEHRKLVDRVNMNTKMNKAFYKYLETERDEDLKNAASIQANVSNIEKNTESVSALKKAKRETKALLDTVKMDITSLRDATTYDTERISSSFVKKFEKKYDLNHKQKRMIFDTQLLGMLNPIVLRAFPSTSPDLFIEQHQTDVAELVRVLLHEFEIGKYHHSAKEHNITHYGTEIPVVVQHMSVHANTINLDEKLEFIVESYLPRLVAYIDTNINTIIDDVDTMMDEYFSNYPFVRYLSEFLTRSKPSDFLADESHILTMIAKHSMRMFYTELDITWYSFKYNIATHFTSAEITLLFVLVPEFLIMIKYNQDYFNYKKEHAFTPLIKKFLFSPRKDLNIGNLENYSSIIHMFKCGEDNLLNKILLSHLKNDKHSTAFQELFLEKYNKMVKMSADVGKTLDISFFTSCDTLNSDDDDDEEDNSGITEEESE